MANAPNNAYYTDMWDGFNGRQRLRCKCSNRAVSRKASRTGGEIRVQEINVTTSGEGSRLEVLEKIVIHGNGKDPLLVRVNDLESTMADVLEFQSKASENWEIIKTFVDKYDERQKLREKAEEERLEEEERRERKRTRRQNIRDTLVVGLIVAGFAAVLTWALSFEHHHPGLSQNVTVGQSVNAPQVSGAEFPH